MSKEIHNHRHYHLWPDSEGVFCLSVAIAIVGVAAAFTCTMIFASKYEHQNPAPIVSTNVVEKIGK